MLEDPHVVEGEGKEEDGHGEVRRRKMSSEISTLTQLPYYFCRRIEVTYALISSHLLCYNQSSTKLEYAFISNLCDSLFYGYSSYGREPDGYSKKRNKRSISLLKIYKNIQICNDFAIYPGSSIIYPGSIISFKRVC